MLLNKIFIVVMLPPDQDIQPECGERVGSGHRHRCRNPTHVAEKAHLDRCAQHQSERAPAIAVVGRTSGGRPAPGDHRNSTAVRRRACEPVAVSVNFFELFPGYLRIPTIIQRVFGQTGRLAIGHESPQYQQSLAAAAAAAGLFEDEKTGTRPPPRTR